MFILSLKGLMFLKNDGISIFLNICIFIYFVLNIVIKFYVVLVYIEFYL